jgi:hypothetical protein
MIPLLRLSLCILSVLGMYSGVGIRHQRKREAWNRRTMGLSLRKGAMGKSQDRAHPQLEVLCKGRSISGG